MVSVNPNGPVDEVTALLSDEVTGEVHHVTLKMPIERKRLIDNLKAIGTHPFGEKREQGKTMRAAIEDKIFAAAEKKLKGKVTPPPAPARRPVAKKKRR